MRVVQQFFRFSEDPAIVLCATFRSDRFDMLVDGSSCTLSHDTDQIKESDFLKRTTPMLVNGCLILADRARTGTKLGTQNIAAAKIKLKCVTFLSIKFSDCGNDFNWNEVQLINCWIRSCGGMKLLQKVNFMAIKCYYFLLKCSKIWN